MAPLKKAESSALPSSPASGDGLSLTSTQPAGWPTITNRPADNLRVKREIWSTIGSTCEGSSYRHICPSRKRIQRMKSVFPHSCQKGLANIWPYSRRRESAYILSYQSLFSVSINRASPGQRREQSCQGRDRKFGVYSRVSSAVESAIESEGLGHINAY